MNSQRLNEPKHLVARGNPARVGVPGHRTIAVAALLTACGYAAACPIDTTLGGGTCTAPFTGGGTFVKSNPTVRQTIHNIVTADSAWGNLHLQIPDPQRPPADFVIWAAAGPDGYTGVFFGNSITAHWTYSFTYSVSCGPCPIGTPISMTLDGTAVSTQYAAAAGALKLGGSASATVTGSMVFPPFPGSPFTLGPAPATVTAAAPGLGVAQAGNVNAVTVPFGSATVQLCPLGPQTVLIDLHVTASRTGGATSATASFDSIDASLTTTCACPSVTPSNQTIIPPDLPNDPPHMSPPPVFSPPLQRCSDVPVSAPDALLAMGDGSTLLAQSVPSVSVADRVTTGPQTVRAVYTSGPPIPLGQPLGLVSSMVRGMRATGPFATSNIIAAEALTWDGAQHNFRHTVNVLQVSNVPSAPAFGAQLPLSQPLVAPSALAFGNQTPVFGTDLLVALPDSGQIGSITQTGQVHMLPLPDLGSPSAMAFSSRSGSYQGALFVTDVGVRRPDGVLQDSTGRLLMVNAFTPNAVPFATGLRTPVSVVVGPGSFIGLPGEVVYVLSAGTIDQQTGFLVPSTGRLSAFMSPQAEMVLADQLDSPLKMQFITQTELVIATQTELMTVVNTPCQAPCPADWNHDGSVSSQDFFDFITALFSVSPAADFNHDGAVNSQDFFDFITAFFAGC